VSQFLDCAVFQKTSSVRTTVFKEERGTVMGCGKRGRNIEWKERVKKVRQNSCKKRQIKINGLGNGVRE
jgi:hypothetical protein